MVGLQDVAKTLTLRFSVPFDGNFYLTQTFSIIECKMNLRTPLSYEMRG